MADRSQAEIRDLIFECERQARLLDAAELFWHQVEDGSYDYTKDIPPELGQAVPLHSRMLTQDSANMVGALSWPIRINVDIDKLGPVAEKQGDDLEVAFSHSFLRMDPRGIVKAGIHSHQVRSRFAAVWMSINEHKYPARRPKEPNKSWQDRCDEYDESYWRWSIGLLAPNAVGHLAFDGEITVATLHDELPILNIAQLYGEGEDKDPLTVMGKQFPYLRAGEGTNIERGGQANLITKTFKRWIIADSGKISHYFEVTEGKEPRYELAAETYDNTFGRVPLTLITGIYRPHAPIETRYEALMGPLASCVQQLAVMESIYATVVANRRWVEPLGTEVAMQQQGMPPDIKTLTARTLAFRGPDGTPMIPQSLQPLQDVSNILPPEFAKIYEEKKKEYEQLRMSITAISPSPETVERSTAAGILFNASAAMIPYKGAHQSISSGYEQMAEMMAHDIIHGMNPHLLKGEKAPGGKEKSLKFSAAGGEMTSKPVEGGKAYDIAPAQFMPILEKKARIRVELVAETDAQRMAAGQMAMMRYNAGMATPEDVLEAFGESNTSKKIMELAEWNNVKLLAPSIASAAMQNVTQRIAIRDRRDPQVIAQMLAGGQSPSNAAGGGGGGTSAPQTTGTPAGPVPMDQGLAS